MQVNRMGTGSVRGWVKAAKIPDNPKKKIPGDDTWIVGLLVGEGLQAVGDRAPGPVQAVA